MGQEDVLHVGRILSQPHGCSRTPWHPVPAWAGAASAWLMTVGWGSQGLLLAPAKHPLPFPCTLGAWGLAALGVAGHGAGAVPITQLAARVPPQCLARPRPA